MNKKTIEFAITIPVNREKNTTPGEPEKFVRHFIIRGAENEQDALAYANECGLVATPEERKSIGLWSITTKVEVISFDKENDYAIATEHVTWGANANANG